MPSRKQQLLRRTIAGARSQAEIVSHIDEVFAAFQAQQSKLYPSARRWLYSEITKGVRFGTLQTRYDVLAASAALLAAAAKVADPERPIRIAHLRKGWSQYLSRPGNCPPHRCFFRTVISQKEALTSRLPLYRVLVEQFEE